jgi:hypothetical protein
LNDLLLQTLLKPGEARALADRLPTVAGLECDDE